MCVCVCVCVCVCIFIYSSFAGHRDCLCVLAIVNSAAKNWIFPRWLSDKESACNAGGTGLIPGSGRSPGEGNGNQPGGSRSMGLKESDST